MNEKSVQIKSPNFMTAVFGIKGTSPLVIHRFNIKAKKQMVDDYERGSKNNAGKKKHEPKDLDAAVEECKYVSPQGWEGFHAAAIRKSIISACRVVNFKMTLAKLSVFVIEDGRDKFEPQIPLIRIYGKAVRQDDIGRTSTGDIILINRPAYHDWSAKVKIRWDGDQFSIEDIANLLSRAGYGGIGEGRNDSKDSAGMGWGCFEVTK